MVVAWMSFAAADDLPPPGAMRRDEAPQRSSCRRLPSGVFRPRGPGRRPDPERLRLHARAAAARGATFGSSSGLPDDPADNGGLRFIVGSAARRFGRGRRCGGGTGGCAAASTTSSLSNRKRGAMATQPPNIQRRRRISASASMAAISRLRLRWARRGDRISVAVRHLPGINLAPEGGSDSYRHRRHLRRSPTRAR